MDYEASQVFEEETMDIDYDDVDQRSQQVTYHLAVGGEVDMDEIAKVDIALDDESQSDDDVDGHSGDDSDNSLRLTKPGTRGRRSDDHCGDDSNSDGQSDSDSNERLSNLFDNKKVVGGTSGDGRKRVRSHLDGKPGSSLRS